MAVKYSVGDELVRLFPDGTTGSRVPDWQTPPLMPTDIFAAGAHLLNVSGAFQYIAAPMRSASSDIDRFTYGAGTATPSQADIDLWCRLGAQFAHDPESAPDIRRYWRTIWNCRDQPLVITPRSTCPRWWRAAHALLVIADQASEELGYTFSLGPGAKEGEEIAWANGFANMMIDHFTRRSRISSVDAPGERRHSSVHVALDSLTDLAARHVARVLPKGRTSDLGCTLRTLSHNLALVPGHGNGCNAYWHLAQRGPKDGSNTLNVMLVPFPYVIPAGSFKGLECDATPGVDRWGRFAIEQRWLHAAPSSGLIGKVGDASSRAALVAFFDALVKRADGLGKPANALIFPEYAFDWETHDAVVRHALDHWPDVEFIVSGVSVDCTGEEGNHVVMTTLSGATPKRRAQTHSRRKHHRWCVDGNQVRGYGLEADLDPDVTWWEHLDVRQRVLQIEVFRNRSAFTAVICEDLARVEPGLEMVRDLGPNLVFALLMDGAQIKSRWPGVYATALADEPGSSVLTLTSLGLIQRSNEVRQRAGDPTSRSVAFWKSRARKAIPAPTPVAEVNLDVGSHAVILALESDPASETTMDGRPNSDTSAWFCDQKPSQIRLDSAIIQQQGWEWITEGSGPGR